MRLKPAGAKAPKQKTDVRLLHCIGKAAEAIGTKIFHTRLLSILDCLIRSDMRLVLRYSRHAKPDYLVNKGLSKEAVSLYLSGYYSFDPAYRLCRRSTPSGVISFRALSTRVRRSNAYFNAYAPRARITDDLGMFLPGVGGAVVAIFLERRSGHFSKGDVAAMKRLYPVLRGLYKAHLQHLFLSFASHGQPAHPDETERALMIEDAGGTRLCASRLWCELEQSHEHLAEGLQKLQRSRTETIRLADGSVLHLEQLDSDFPLAPDGRAFFVEKEAASPAGISFEDAVASFLSGRLTSRERDIVSLMLSGHSIDDIAVQLRITRGTVKNHRGRLYKKLGILYERQLLSLFLDHLRACGPNSSHPSDTASPASLVKAQSELA
jgi:DNA-binding CsgD family transcriptional regulator